MRSDNKVSTNEWKHMWYVSMGQASAGEDLAWQQLYVDYMFTLFDASGASFVHMCKCNKSSTGDGFIDLAEFVETMSYYGFDKRHATWAFDQFAQVHSFSHELPIIKSIHRTRREGS